jgi:hypothetical protein
MSHVVFLYYVYLKTYLLKLMNLKQINEVLFFFKYLLIYEFYIIFLAVYNSNIAFVLIDY